METYSDRIKIVVGDITKLPTEAIVNAANKSLLGGGGVDGAIHRAAGKGLLQECMTLGGCETGRCKMTEAYNLPCKKVIHAVGPVWHGGHHGEGKLLASCYDSAMKIAEENELSSIAFSCISTGVYGFPKKEAARIALHTVFAHIRDNYPGQVVICCFSEEDVQYYQDCFWDESLTLLGSHEAIQQYKEKTDTIPSKFWDEMISCIPHLEQEVQQSGSKHSNDCNLEERLGFCTSPADYQCWIQCFKINEMPDFLMIDNVYCLFVIGTFISRRAYWTNSNATPEELLEFLKPIREYRWKIPYIKFFKTIEELHKRGYEQIRICPSISPNGCSWRCITTIKKLTASKCGAVFAGEGWTDLAINTSNGIFRSVNREGKHEEWPMEDIPICELADRFIDSFPTLAKAGKGYDPEYAKWFHQARKECERGHILYAFAEMESCYGEGHLFMSSYEKSAFPFPPPGETEGYGNY